ncbi:hypothetical protein [Embleya sp. NPDC001921]
MLADGVPRTYVHLYVMRHLSGGLVEELLADLRRPGAFAAAPADPPRLPRQRLGT